MPIPAPLPAEPAVPLTDPRAAAGAARREAPDLQALLVTLVNDLLHAPTGQIDAQIDRSLGHLGAALGVDRCHVLRLRDDGDLEKTRAWTAAGQPPRASRIAAPAAQWLAALERNEPVQIDGGDPAGSPWLDGALSLLLVPLRAEGRLVGCVGLDRLSGRRTFSPAEADLARTVATVIGTLLRRLEKEGEIACAQHALQAERNRLRATLDAMPDLVLELDGDGRFVGWHAGHLSILPEARDGLIGLALEDVLPADVAALARRIMREVDEAGWCGGYEYALDAPSGRRWHSVSAATRAGQGPGERPGYLFVVRDITEMQAQRRQVARLGKFAELTTNFVIVTDAAHRIEWVNPAFEAQTGFALEEATGQPLCSVLNCNMADSMIRLREMLQAGQPARAELLASSRTGASYWLDLAFHPLLDEAGTPRGFMAVGSDITAHKHQETQLAATAEDALAARLQLATAVETLPDAFAYYDAEDRLVLCNQRYHDYYPRSSSAMVPGTTFEEILRYGLARGEYREAVGQEEEWLARRLESHRRDWNEQEQQLADGRWLRVLERSTPDGGKVGLRVDVTALKLAEERARGDLTSAMDASRDGIAITDAAGRYVYMNRSHMEMVGVANPSDILGHSWTELFHPETAALLRDTALPTLQAEGGWQGEVIGRRMDGSELPQEVSLTVKEGGGFICITRDISKRLREQQEHLRLRDELQLAQRREIIGQLAAGLAHDLNNLLAAMGGSATLIRGALPAEVEAHAQRILTASEQAGALVRRFLSLGARQSNRSLIDLRNPLRDAVDLVRTSLRGQIRLTVSLPEAPVQVEADPTDILQVVLNLVINARDAILASPRAAEPNEIAISLTEATEAETEGPFAAGSVSPGQRYVCMSVRDTGPGIDAETQAKVFQPYFSTKGAAGTGLGLAIVAGVLGANHAAVALDSAPGRGTRFAVMWPTEVRQFPEEPAPAAAPQTACGLSGRTILIADDNDDVLRVLTAFLEHAGAEVVPCSDPRDALEAVRDDPAMWDLLVTDYDMPHLTGADLAQAAHLAAPELPVLLITALPDWRGRVGSAIPRFAGVLGKPVGRSDFVAAAESALRLPVRES